MRSTVRANESIYRLPARWTAVSLKTSILIISYNQESFIAATLFVVSPSPCSGRGFLCSPQSLPFTF